MQPDSGLRLFAAMLLACAPAAMAQAPPADVAADLAGRTWELVQIQGSDGKTLTPDVRSKYTLTFQRDGRVSARLDCNRGTGSWKSTARNQLEFRSMAVTRAMCPPQSLGDRMARDLGRVNSYSLKDGHLFLSGDAGVYEFEPQPSKPAVRRAEF